MPSVERQRKVVLSAVFRLQKVSPVRGCEIRAEHGFASLFAVSERGCLAGWDTSRWISKLEKLSLVDYTRPLVVIRNTPDMGKLDPLGGHERSIA